MKDSKTVIENEVRENLALTYRFLAELKMDDLTYTHISARVPGSRHFYVYPLGQLFSEVTADSLLTVSLDGTVVDGTEPQYNQTGYVMHGSIYNARPDLNAIIHLHTTAGVAVSIMGCGLLPMSQFSFHFYNRMAYHQYNSLVLDREKQGSSLVEDLGIHKAMFLRNHGTITCGSTIQEAFFYAYYLEKACMVQCTVMKSGAQLICPPPEVCEQAAQDMLAFEKDLGFRDWHALKRKYDQK